eukprot:320081_1
MKINIILFICVVIPISALTAPQMPLYGCTADVFQCRDGSFVSRNPNNNCEFSPCPVASVGCGINHCTSYNDGCNTCTCVQNGIGSCTERACFSNVVIPPFCIGCEPGYILNPINDQCEPCICTMQYDPVCCSDGNTYSNQCQANCQQANGCKRGACDINKPLTAPICGGFSNCQTYFDGCNNCFCGNYGGACTKKYCAIKEPSKCLFCKSGYTLIGNNCVDSLPT